MMRLLKKLLCTVIAFVVVLTCLPVGSVVLADNAASLKPGLDIIILVDISFSNFPGKNEKAHDTDMMCLDAAAMLINMCDSEYSRVAVVPFTNVVPPSQWWNTWVDVSDTGNRTALCNELYSVNMLSMNGAKWHNGNTNHRIAMEAALELMNTRSTNNPVLVVMLGDSDIPEPSEKNDYAVEDPAVVMEKSLAAADEIKKQNATIYCLDMKEADDPTDKVLYRIASDDNGDKSDYYWSRVSPSELKIRFSDIFADMIGSTRITQSAYVDEEKINYELFIPNRSVTEVNLVLDRSFLKNSSFKLMRDGEKVDEDDSMIIYSRTEIPAGAGSYSDAAKTYDFISVKLMNPEPGEWVISSDKGDDVSAGTQTSYDILYNYQIEPVVYDMADPFYQSETVHFVSQFLNTETNTVSDDDSLYRGDSIEGHPGIEATLTVFDAAGNTVGSFIMTPDQQNLCFSYDFALSGLGAIPGGTSSYSYEVNVRGDNMNKTSGRAMFQVENTAPKTTGLSEIDWPNRLEIVNIFDSGSNGQLEIGSDVLDGYFTDDDGDPITYSVAGTNNVKANIDNTGKLTIEKADDEVHDDAYVTVTASDPAGQTAQMQINVDVLSVKSLVEECVSLNLNVTSEGEGTNLVKGETVTVDSEFIIALPEGASKEAFPYNYLNDVITQDKLAANSTVVYNWENDGEIECIDNGDGTAHLNIGNRDGATVNVYAEAEIGVVGNMVTRTAETGVYTVMNAEPSAENIGDAMTEAGAIVTTDAEGNTRIVFEVDKDKENASKLAFDMTSWFSDADVDNGSDEFVYTVTVEPLEETSDIFSIARSLLRLVGLTEKDGPIVEVAGTEPNEVPVDVVTDVDTYTLNDAALNMAALRFGNARVTVTATDGVSNAEQTFEYRITSSVERIKCIVVYAIMLAILIVIIAILINKLVIHQPWPNKRQAGYFVQLNGFDQMTMTGQLESKFLITGRKAKKLSDLAKNFYIADGGVGNSAFAQIVLWPTLGGNIVVEPSKKAKKSKAEVKVGGQPLNKKRKWTRNSTIVVKYDDGMGNAYECVFKR